MAIPKYNEMMPAIIDCLGDGKVHALDEMLEFVSDTFHLTAAESAARLGSGQLHVNNRMSWACSYLKNARLIENPARASYCLTKEGMKAYRKGSDCVTLEYLRQFPWFNEFEAGRLSGRKKTVPLARREVLQQREELSQPLAEKSVEETERQMTMDLAVEQSPQERVDDALAELNCMISDDLMSVLMNLSGRAFEHLIERLLVKMGYGFSRLYENTMTESTSEEGLLCTITADKFGFDPIYVQAKQLTPKTTIGRSEIQQILGTFAGRDAEKGLFITTAHFSEEAVRFVQNQAKVKIVLVDGVQLTKLMIEYDFGVSSAAIYTVKCVDYDFFHEEI